MNILEKAMEIMDARSEEKDREYGPFGESLERAAIIATQMTGKEITAIDFMKCMIALKLSRMRYNIKEDTMLDAVAYIHGLNEYNKELQKEVNDLKEVFKEEYLNVDDSVNYLRGPFNKI